MEPIQASSTHGVQAWSTGSQGAAPAQVATSKVLSAQESGLQQAPTGGAYQGALSKDFYAGGMEARSAWSGFNGVGAQPGLAMDDVGLSKQVLAQGSPLVGQGAWALSEGPGQLGSVPAGGGLGSVPGQKVVQSTQALDQTQQGMLSQMAAGKVAPQPTQEQLVAQPTVVRPAEGQPPSSTSSPRTSATTERRELERRLLMNRSLLEQQRTPTARQTDPELDRRLRELRSKHGGGGSKLTLGPTR